MTWRKVWRGVVAGGMLLAVVALRPDGATEQSDVSVPSSVPIYAIPLRDGSTALVWWDAVSDPAHPGWRCEVLRPHGGGGGRRITTLTAATGDWRAALAEARAILEAQAANGE